MINQVADKRENIQKCRLIDANYFYIKVLYILLFRQFRDYQILYNGSWIMDHGSWIMDDGS
jgi:hypothetical protein